MHALQHSECPNLQQATTDPRLCQTPGHPQASLGQSLVGSLLLSPGSWCTLGFVYALQESVSRVLCKFWWLSGGVNGDLLPEGLCQTHVCCTQSPSGRPLLTWTCAGDAQTLKSGSSSVSVGSPGIQKVLFIPSECLWPVWSLVLKVVSPLLLSCWSFFAYRHGVSFFLWDPAVSW